MATCFAVANKPTSWLWIQNTFKWVVFFIPSTLIGRKDFLRESFRDASAVQNVPYARKIVHLSFQECFRDASAVQHASYAREIVN